MTGEGSELHDPSAEHLAPVTYLPWVRHLPAPTSEERPGEAGTARRSAPARRPRRAAEAFADRGSDDAVPDRWFGEEVPSEPVAARDTGSKRSQAARGTRVGSVPEGVADESGVERDERIDRLVVSRLRRSALSVSEVRAVLAEHGLDDSELDEWIERYERLGYLDDARLAEQLVHSQGVRRGKGSGALLNELGRRGVDQTVARAAVEDLDPETELENARTVAERRARQLRGLDRQTAERRLSAFLQRRGYPGDVVREAVTAALSVEGS
ncbi:regulatory protein RecX [Agromyces italicus]|uniref:regulatory protein RecX n=1 Tax=Agromyces italicus TaxID=279572 RepID=UPI0003B51CDF|nr:regulatory protein RecX [Agromyces italicus]